MKIIIATIGVGAVIAAMYFYSPERVEYTAPEREVVEEMEEMPVDSIDAAALQLAALKEELNAEEVTIDAEIAALAAEYEATIAELTTAHASATEALQERKDAIDNLRQSFQ